MLNRLYNAARLALVLGAVWLMLVGPAAYWQGSRGVEGLSWAVLVCLLPGLFVVVQLAGLGVERPLAGLVVGMGLRLAVVVVLAVLLCLLDPHLRGKAFLVWLVPCYLAALAVETRLLLDGGAGREAVPAAACRT